jgi:hypothetical protein
LLSNKDVFNGDIGQIVEIDSEEREVTIRFDQRDVVYDFGELDEVSLAYAITIHKSQGSEFPAVVIPRNRSVKEESLSKMIVFGEASLPEVLSHNVLHFHERKKSSEKRKYDSFSEAGGPNW